VKGSELWADPMSGNDTISELIFKLLYRFAILCYLSLCLVSMLFHTHFSQSDVNGVSHQPSKGKQPPWLDGWSGFLFVCVVHIYPSRNLCLMVRISQI